METKQVICPHCGGPATINVTDTESHNVSPCQECNMEIHVYTDEAGKLMSICPEALRDSEIRVAYTYDISCPNCGEITPINVIAQKGSGSDQKSICRHCHRWINYYITWYQGGYQRGSHIHEIWGDQSAYIEDQDESQ